MNRNPTPQPRAAVLRNFLSIIILAEKSGNEYNNSETTKRSNTITASHRLISDNVKGKCVGSHPSIILYQTSKVRLSVDRTCFCIVISLLEALAIAQAVALTIGSPMSFTLAKFP